MKTIQVSYPNGHYDITVTDEQYYIYNALYTQEGYRAANIYGRSIVTARRRGRHVIARPIPPIDDTPMVCINRACYSCGNTTCEQRICEES